MKQANRIQFWAKRVFVWTCVLVVAFSAGVLCARFNVASPLVGATCAFVVMTLVYLIIRQIRITNDVHLLKTLALETVQADSSPEQKGMQPAAFDSKLATFKDSFDQFENRLSTLEDRLNSVTEQTAAVSEVATQKTVSSTEAKATQMPLPKMPAQRTMVKRSTSRKVSKVADHHAALRDGDLNMHLQPIVELPDRQPVLFEAFMRLESKSEGVLEERAFRQIVGAAGLMASIDQKVLFTSLRLLKQLSTLKRPTGILCTLSPQTASDSAIMAKIDQSLGAQPDLASWLKVQMGQRDYLALRPQARERFEGLTSKGVSLGLKDVVDFDLDYSGLAAKGFQTLKAAASMLVHAEFARNGTDVALKQLAMEATAHGIDIIADGLDDDGLTSSVSNNGIALAQGMHFAPPRPVKPELLSQVSDKAGVSADAA